MKLRSWTPSSSRREQNGMGLWGSTWVQVISNQIDTREAFSELVFCLKDRSLKVCLILIPIYGISFAAWGKQRKNLEFQIQLQLLIGLKLFFFTGNNPFLTLKVISSPWAKLRTRGGKKQQSSVISLPREYLPYFHFYVHIFLHS